MRLQAQSLRGSQLLDKLIRHPRHPTDIDDSKPPVITDGLRNVIDGDAPALERDAMEVTISRVSTAPVRQEQAQPPLECAASVAAAEDASQAFQEQYPRGVTLVFARVPRRVLELDRVPRVRALGEVARDAHQRVDADAAGDEDDLAKCLDVSCNVSILEISRNRPRRVWVWEHRQDKTECGVSQGDGGEGRRRRAAHRRLDPRGRPDEAAAHADAQLRVQNLVRGPP